MAKGRKFNQLVIHKGKQHRVISRGLKVKGLRSYNLATVEGGRTVIKSNVSSYAIRKSRSKGKGRGWHGDSAGHARAAKKGSKRGKRTRIIGSVFKTRTII